MSDSIIETLERRNAIHRAVANAFAPHVPFIARWCETYMNMYRCDVRTALREAIKQWPCVAGLWEVKGDEIDTLIARLPEGLR